MTSDSIIGLEDLDGDAESNRTLIEQRAYEISLSSEAEGDIDNWLRAEREVQALRASA